jgi:CubicO group peptidase (beta-lactamase class C family)
MLRRFFLGTLAIAALPACLTAQMATRDLTPLVNRVFARWDSTTGPGCSVGIDRAGQPRYTRAFGEADLEYDIPNKPETIFEAGSISKQFTAAATALLALEGKLNFEDDVRKYVPELPQYQRPITIRHLLNHTSGLRDWGEIAALAGWPRETRVHTHDDVLDILHRQRALNYPPGDRYSYTNSGYNLLAIIVSRVSGQPFATFSRERIFKPLGLTSTQWRDDFRRVVKGRAQAYARANGGQWELEMPFENVHGNGGLLTTVSDLLTWTAMLEHPTPQWKPLVDSLHVRGRLTKGDTITYALGLVVSDYRGVPRVEHSGATAGYRAELLRFPGKGLAIAVLCNAASANPVLYASQLVDSLLPGLGPAAARPPRPRADSSTWKPNADDLAAYAGTYYSPDVETTLEISVTNGALTLFRRSATRVTLRPLSKDTFGGFDDRVWFTRDQSGRVNALHVAGSRAYDVVFERRG